MRGPADTFAELEDWTPGEVRDVGGTASEEFEDATGGALDPDDDDSVRDCTLDESNEVEA